MSWSCWRPQCGFGALLAQSRRCVMAAICTPFLQWRPPAVAVRGRQTLTPSTTAAWGSHAQLWVDSAESWGTLRGLAPLSVQGHSRRVPPSVTSCACMDLPPAEGDCSMSRPACVSPTSLVSE